MAGDLALRHADSGSISPGPGRRPRRLGIGGIGALAATVCLVAGAAGPGAVPAAAAEPDELVTIAVEVDTDQAGNAITTKRDGVTYATLRVTVGGDFQPREYEDPATGQLHGRGATLVGSWLRDSGSWATPEDMARALTTASACAVDEQRRQVAAAASLEALFAEADGSDLVWLEGIEQACEHAAGLDTTAGRGAGDVPSSAAWSAYGIPIPADGRATLEVPLDQTSWVAVHVLDHRSYGELATGAARVAAAVADGGVGRVWSEDSWVWQSGVDSYPVLVAEAISIPRPADAPSSDQPADESGDNAVVDGEPAADDGLPPWLLIVSIAAAALIIAGVVTAIALRRRAAGR